MKWTGCGAEAARRVFVAEGLLAAVTWVMAVFLFLVVLGLVEAALGVRTESGAVLAVLAAWQAYFWERRACGGLLSVLEFEGAAAVVAFVVAVGGRGALVRQFKAVRPGGMFAVSILASALPRGWFRLALTVWFYATSAVFKRRFGAPPVSVVLGVAAAMLGPAPVGVAVAGLEFSVWGQKGRNGVLGPFGAAVSVAMGLNLAGLTRYASEEAWRTAGEGFFSKPAVRVAALTGDRVLSFAVVVLGERRGWSVAQVAEAQRELVSNPSLARYFDARLKAFVSRSAVRSEAAKGTAVEAFVGASVSRVVEEVDGADVEAVVEFVVQELAPVLEYDLEE